LCAILTLLAQFGAPPPALAANETVAIDFAVSGGAPTYRASGFIYGLSPDATQPPPALLSDIKVKVLRGGGSQLGCPAGGWVNGQLTPRWNMVKAFTAKARSLGGNFSIIMAGLWGSDGVCNVPRWPGDGGNWAEFDSFLDQLMSLAQADGINGAGVRWDIWNEPNIFFWGRTQSQYFAMWKRAVQRIRATFPNAVIEGPSCACGPDNPWFGQFLDYVKANNVVPNILSWHALPGDPVAQASAANAALSARSLTVSGYSINEYGAKGDEQQPGPSAWYIARLERANGGVDGARANWGMVGQNPSLYATMGWLVTTNNQPMGQWWVYKRYADQTGVRTNIIPSASVDGVVFQDGAAKKSITLLGKKAGGGTGTVTAQFNNVPSFLAVNGSVSVLVERMPSSNAAVSAPTVVFSGPMQLSGSSLAVNISWGNALDAYAVTLSAPSTPGGTATPTPVTPTPVTPTPGTPTATRTPTPSTPTATRTPAPNTPTPTPGSGPACSPVTGTITAPFSYDGAGTFCWQIASIPSYINSWNLDNLTINGVSFTNTYIFATNLPPKINGYWYVSYSGQYAWSHFEAK
jgi:cell division septation protein DedD